MVLIIVIMLHDKDITDKQCTKMAEINMTFKHSLSIVSTLEER